MKDQDMKTMKKEQTPVTTGHLLRTNTLHILKRVKRICKRVRWENVTILLLSIACVTLLVIQIVNLVGEDTSEPIDEYVPVVIFPEEETVRYKLTEEERWVVASVVTAEAAGEPYMGKVAVAQCILQACENDGIRPTEAVVTYRYAKSRPEPTEEAMRAVEAVFDRGEVATDEPIIYFYAPALVYSEWHETQVYVMTISGHKFFKEAPQ
jgi:hypothetical protein